MLDTARRGLKGTVGWAIDAVGGGGGCRGLWGGRRCVGFAAESFDEALSIHYDRVRESPPVESVLKGNVEAAGSRALHARFLYP